MARNLPDNIDDNDPRAPWSDDDTLLDDDGNPVEDEDEDDDMFDNFGAELYSLPLDFE